MKFYQLPNSNLFTHRMLFFSREGTSKIYTPGLFSHHNFKIYFAIYLFIYLQLLFSDLYYQKPKNTSLNFICCYSICIFQSIYLPIVYPRGIDNPSYASGCKYLFFVCRCCLCCVAWFSYWFDNLGFITAGNTYCSCVAASLPLRGKTDADTSYQERISGAVAGEQ